jgi:hypothetical protein
MLEMGKSGKRKRKRRELLSLSTEQNIAARAYFVAAELGCRAPSTVSRMRNVEPWFLSEA